MLRLELQFDKLITLEKGVNSDLLHLWDNDVNNLFLEDGRLYSSYTHIDQGYNWNIDFENKAHIDIDEDMECFRIDSLGGFGAVGSYKSGNTHKLIIYEYQFDISEYLNNGSIKHSISNPISSFTLSLENAKNPNRDYEGNIAIDEHSSLISPGAKVMFKFGAGEEIAEYEMGTFYVDRSNFTLLSETANIDGRNIIGKALKDQTLDENNEYWYDTLTNILKDLFKTTGIDKNKVIVENTSKKHWFTFAPNTTYMKAIEQILELLPGWKITELVDGRIVVSDETSLILPRKSQYLFHRNKDIFSRDIVRDDGEVYRRVCVHTESQGFMVYRDIEIYEGWSLGAKKTLYVSVADGTRYSDVENYADELKKLLENSGKIESFTGPFRPYLTCGDEAIIADEKGSESLGLITEITHNFGKNGFSTNFTVDSGGKLGKGRISDYIKKIATGSMEGSKAGYSDIDTSQELYTNIAKQAKIITPNMLFIDRLVDENLETYWLGFMDNQFQDFIIFDFKQRCIIDKITTFRYSEEIPEGIHDIIFKPMVVEYWNGAIWKPLFEIPRDGEWKVENTFEQIETSKIRYRFLPNEGLIRIYGIEIWGWM